MKLISGIAGFIVGAIGCYFLLLFYVLNHWHAHPPQELLTEIYLIETCYSLFLLILMSVSLKQVVKCFRTGVY